MSPNRENDRVPSRILVTAVRTLAKAVSRLFWRIEFHNTENIPEKTGGGFILAANHPTYFDPFWVSLPIEADLRYLTWDRAFDWPFAGGLIARLGAIPTSLGPGGSLGTLKRSLTHLRNGCGLVIFPEGEREYKDGGFLPFKTGVAQLASRTGVPVLPVSIVGGSRVWPRGNTFPGLGKVDIYFHPLFWIGKPDEEADEHTFLNEQTKILREIIASALDNAKSI